MAFQSLDPLIREVPGFQDLFRPDRPTDHNFGASRARALLEWFRTHPLSPLTSHDETSGDATRRRAINGAIAVLHDVGPDRFTVEVAASRGGLTPDQIYALFPTRQALITAAVERWSRAVSAPLFPLAAERGAVAYLHALTVAYAEEPALMRVLASVLALSGDRNAEGSATFRALYETFRQTIRNALANDITAGREPKTMDPERGAQQLLALYDGLRIQSLLTDGLDIVDAFDRAATRMRRGWAEQYEQPDYWEIGTVHDLAI
ncbi:TetR family transcriptional regulator C-terminal domain-containing protein [Frigoribacterium sp. NBH87]|uniref:TetR family transcriptional regulator C-terminal domain-containing protein n=1 Tax=Frigoribacterium sp. NBH87 TaxID=2596916 RepID=UPI0021081AA4|nr:TetR family transcriptional regulator C-terminal domain-containing protein [Frigoribacterium sp. NBH87]